MASSSNTVPPMVEDKFTSSTTGTLYFAYGSNLSPSQMRLRCAANPQRSATPVAITRLDGYKWLICQRGYANITKIKAPGVLSGELPTNECVYGVVYDMDPLDITLLDSYEGCGVKRDPYPEPNPDPNPGNRERVPHLQRHRDYNKHYIPVTVTKWLVDPTKLGINVPSGGEITVLVYVDEIRTGEGGVVPSYIGRMNRAIRESAALGMPEDWLNTVMRKWITEGVELEDQGFVGNAAGHQLDFGTEDRGTVKEATSW